MKIQSRRPTSNQPAYIICLIGLLVLCLSIATKAQEVTISETYDIFSQENVELIGMLDSSILLYCSDKVHHKIQAFDTDLKLTWQKELDLEKKRPKVIEVIPEKSDFVVLFSSKKKGELILSGMRHDAKANKKDTSTIFNYGFSLNTKKFKVVLSEHKKYALVYYYESFRTLKAIAVALDSMEMAWTKELVIEDLPLERDLSELIITDQGTLYFVLGLDNKVYKQGKHRFELIQFGVGDQEAQKFNKIMRDKMTYDVAISFDNLNKRLLAVGMYSDKSLSRANGYYLLSIDESNPEDESLAFEAFTYEMLLAIHQKKKKKKKLKKKLKGLSDIEIRELILRRDGGVILVMEQVKKYERNYGPGSGSGMNNMYTRDFSYEDMIVQSIHPNGSAHWFDVLPKKQYSTDDEGIFSSFFPMKTSRNLRLVYNDEIKHDNTVSEYVISANGDHRRNSVMSTDEHDLKLMFRESVQISGDELIVPSLDKNNLKLVKITY